MVKNQISYDVASENLRYDSETGRLIRIKKTTSGRLGEPVGNTSRNGHRSFSLFDRTFSASKVTWLLNYKEWPPGILRHKNGVNSDDRIENLELVKKPFRAKVERVEGTTDGQIPSEHGIYLITCKANGRKYVGSAVNLDKRWRLHTTQLDTGKHGNAHLQKAWNKYGPEEFFFKVLELVEDKSQLIEREQFYINTLSPEFNICKVANSKQGVKASPELRARLSAAHKGKPSGRKGVAIPEHVKRKISESKRGVRTGPPSEETRLAIARGQRKGKNALTDDEVREIRRLHSVGVKCTEIAAAIGRGYYAVHDVLRGRTFTWVQ